MFVALPGVNSIQYTHTGLRGRDERTHLSHNAYEGNLADVGALASHIWPGDYHSSPAFTLNKQKREAITLNCD